MTVSRSRTARPTRARATTMVFTALQTYGGQVLRWIDLATDRGEGPEHPAPVLEVMRAAPAATGRPSRKTRARL